jgi:hypothetical protein
MFASEQANPASGHRYGCFVWRGYLLSVCRILFSKEANVQCKHFSRTQTGSTRRQAPVMRRSAVTRQDKPMLWPALEGANSATDHALSASNRLIASG